MFLYHMRPQQYMKLNNRLGYPQVPSDIPTEKVFIVETMTTGALLFAIYELAFVKKVLVWQLSSFIGMVVFFLSLTAGPVSGCSMNPARTFGPSVWD